MSEWIEWKGGVCPVPAGTLTEVLFDDVTRRVDRKPEQWCWGPAEGIIAYRVLETHPEADRVTALEIENTRLTARIKRLEEALGPLVQELERCEGYKAPEHIPDEWGMAFRVGDLRRARAAYNGEPDAQGSK